MLCASGACLLGRKWSFVRIETPTARWKCRKWQRLNRAVPQTSAPKYREFCLKLDSGAQYQTVSNSGPLAQFWLAAARRRTRSCSNNLVLQYLGMLLRKRRSELLRPWVTEIEIICIFFIFRPCKRIQTTSL